MLEKPALADELIVACLRDVYGLAVTDIEFLPLGYDANAGVYRVTANGQPYFLKAKRDSVHALSVVLPRYLKDHGFEQIVAPLPTITGAPWGIADEFTLLLYPFIEEKGGGLSDPQWVKFGEIVRKLHATRLPPDITAWMPRENFVPHPRLLALMRQLNAEVETRRYDTPLENDLAAFWRDHRQEMHTIAERAEMLGQMLRGNDSDFVLCHADIHTGNLLIDKQDRLFVVDWDQPILAPKERDLMFAYQPDKKYETLFFAGYGSSEVNPQILAYYRYTRLVEDLALFGESVFSPEATDETKRDAIKWFKWNFEPGRLVDQAYEYV